MILVALILIVFLVGRSYPVWWDAREKDILWPAFSGAFKRACLIVIPLSIIFGVIQNAVVIIPAGHRGVVFDKFQGVKQKSLHEGFNFITPLIQEAVLFDIRVQKGEFDASAASKDLQIVHTKVALNFHPEADAVYELYRNIGVDYAEKVIHPAIQEAVKATTALYTAEELIAKREDVKRHIQDILQRQLQPIRLTVTETYITDFDFSAEFAKAVEAKQIAEQEAFKAKRDLERIKIEAEQKIAQAQAEAKSLALQRDAVTPNMIELRRIEAQRLAIEKWDGRMPTTMMGGATPFVDVSRFTTQR